MPLFLDEHEFIPGLTGRWPRAGACPRRGGRPKHGVTYLRYWYDEATGKVFCLVDAPTPDAANEVHREAHGLVADRLVAVTEGG